VLIPFLGECQKSKTSNRTIVQVFLHYAKNEIRAFHFSLRYEIPFWIAFFCFADNTVRCSNQIYKDAAKLWALKAVLAHITIVKRKKRVYAEV
jgi:hypothetical protein